MVAISAAEAEGGGGDVAIVQNVAAASDAISAKMSRPRPFAAKRKEFRAAVDCSIMSESLDSVEGKAASGITAAPLSDSWDKPPSSVSLQTRS
jgi:hypothetical protein